jgi:hypothetical protein
MLLVKIVRIVAGVCLIFLGKEFMEGGLSKYAPLGDEWPLHWGLLAVGVAIMFSGATLIRRGGAKR